MTASPRPSLRVILNPASSGGKGAKLRRRVEEGLRSRAIDFDLFQTRGPEDAVALGRRARNEGVDAVLAVGGDGTIHEIVRGLLDSELEGHETRRDLLPSLGVIPVGTGNDFYRMVATDTDLERALDVFTSGTVTPFDVGVARWDGRRRPFVNLFGVGIDVEVLHRRRAFRRLPGLAQYLSALLAAVIRYRPLPMRVRTDAADGGEWEISSDTHLASVTVGPSAGGGFLLNPGALPDDGDLDLCFIEGLSYGEILRYIPKVIRGTHGGLEVVHLRRLHRARFERPDGRPFSFQLDGELVQDTTERVDIEILPAALAVHVPADFGSPQERPSDRSAANEDVG